MNLALASSSNPDEVKYYTGLLGADLEFTLVVGDGPYADDYFSD